MSRPVKYRIDNITKSSNDLRNYRGLKLDNNLTIMLINDPDTDISAASLSVAVGSLDDPNELPGLSHFCEHMLFMGTRKYPKENEFSRFVLQNGGYYDAYTALDHSNYYCSIKADSLAPLLDRFFRIFFEPLFNSSSTEREINAINAEHEHNKFDDNWRLNQLRRSLADPTHPFKTFGTGSKQTLWDVSTKNNIRVKLLEFYSNWYCSNLMYLAVLGKENLDILEDMVSSIFIHMEKKDVSMPIWIDPIYKEEQLATKTIVVPIKDIRRLYVHFLINDQLPYYKNMPVEYLNLLFRHKGPLSLSAILIRKGWSSGLSASKIFEARGIEQYEICVELTEIGLSYVDDIIKFIFQYLNMIKRQEPQEWVHEEIKNLNAMEFQFKEKLSPLHYVKKLTSRMIIYKLKDVLTAEYLIDEWKPSLITELLSYFRPDNMRVTVISKTFQDQTNTEEKYYGTPFSLSKIPVETINYWLRDDICNIFKMPSKNKYIAKTFKLVPIENYEPETPEIFYNSAILRCWLKKDIEFRIPKAYVSVDFFSPIVAIDPFNFCIMDIFVRLFNEDFSKRTFDIARAKLELTIDSGLYGFNIIFNGFDDKIQRFLKKTINKLLTFNFLARRLEINKREAIRDWNNIEMEQPFRSATRYTDMILTDIAWSPSEIKKSIQNIEVNNVRSFMHTFWLHLHMESLMYGNIDKSMARKLVHELEKPFLSNFNFRPVLLNEMIRSREIKINDGENIVYEKTTTFHSTSAVVVNLQCGTQNTKDNMVVSLFNKIIEESCFNILRTREQLGYVVSAVDHIANGVLYLSIIIQSVYNPAFVHTRIEHFISTIKTLLENLTDEELHKNKESLSTKLFGKPKSLTEQAEIYWSEIVEKHYNFNRAAIEEEMLQSITKNDILEFYQQKVDYAGPKRRSLSIYIRSLMDVKPDKYYDCSDSSTSDDSSEINIDVQKIVDFNEFKLSHRLYPAPAPFIPIEPRI